MAPETISLEGAEYHVPVSVVFASTPSHPFAVSLRLFSDCHQSRERAQTKDWQGIAVGHKATTASGCTRESAIKSTCLLPSSTIAQMLGQQ